MSSSNLTRTALVLAVAAWVSCVTYLLATVAVDKAPADPYRELLLIGTTAGVAVAAVATVLRAAIDVLICSINRLEARLGLLIELLRNTGQVDSEVADALRQIEERLGPPV